MAELCQTAHVSKRTLYQHFAGKDELVAAYLAEVARDSPVEAVLSRSDLAPRARLLELFEALAAGEPPLRGDPFINAAVEVADPSAEAHRLAAEHKRRFVRRLGDLARAAGARDPEGVATRLALLYDGAAAQVVVRGTPEPAAEARAMAAAILSEALDHPSPH